MGCRCFAFPLFLMLPLNCLSVPLLLAQVRVIRGQVKVHIDQLVAERGWNKIPVESY